MSALYQTLSEMKKTYEGFKEYFLDRLDPETDAVKNLRENIKVGLHTIKLVASAVLIGSIAFVFFTGLLLLNHTIGLTLATLSLLTWSIISTISYDVIIASEKGYQLANERTNFVLFNYPNIVGRSALIKECHNLVNQSLKETYLMQSVHQFVFDRYWEALTNYVKINGNQ